jgi:hypothetical protein
MSGHEPLGGVESLPGHQFQHVQVGDGARAHLGDTYNISTYSISQFLIDTERSITKV